MHFLLTCYYWRRCDLPSPLISPVISLNMKNHQSINSAICKLYFFLFFFPTAILPSSLCYCCTMLITAISTFLFTATMLWAMPSTANLHSQLAEPAICVSFWCAARPARIIRTRISLMAMFALLVTATYYCFVSFITCPCHFIVFSFHSIVAILNWYLPQKGLGVYLWNMQNMLHISSAIGRI